MTEIGLHNLRPNPGSTKDTKHLGRGKGTGQGLALAAQLADENVSRVRIDRARGRPSLGLAK